MSAIRFALLLGLLGCPTSDVNESDCQRLDPVEVLDPEAVPDEFEHPWSWFEQRWLGRFGSAPALGLEIELEAQEISAVTQESLTGSICPPSYEAKAILSLRAPDGQLDELQAVHLWFDDIELSGGTYASWALDALVGSLRPPLEDPQWTHLTADLEAVDSGWSLDLFFEGNSYQYLATDELLQASP